MSAAMVRTESRLVEARTYVKEFDVGKLALGLLVAESVAQSLAPLLCRVANVVGTGKIRVLGSTGSRDAVVEIQIISLISVSSDSH